MKVWVEVIVYARAYRLEECSSPGSARGSAEEEREGGCTDRLVSAVYRVLLDRRHSVTSSPSGLERS